MSRKEGGYRSNLERDLAILIDNYLLLNNDEQFGLINKIIGLMYNFKEETNNV